MTVTGKWCYVTSHVAYCDSVAKSGVTVSTVHFERSVYGVRNSVLSKRSL